MTEIEQTQRLVHAIQNTKLIPVDHQVRWSLDEAIAMALAYSHNVSALRIEPLRELQDVGIQYGRFDVVGFVNSTFLDSNTPVGNVINSANPNAQQRVRGEDSQITPGIRRQLPSGGQIELSQQFQVRDDDSGQLTPPNQGRTRLTANLTKELLRGSGRSVAMNQVLVAYHQASSIHARSLASIAAHLNDVANAYWEIFAARGALIANEEGRQQSQRILDELIARKDIDAEPNLIAQAKTTIIQRQANINQARNRLIQAQYRLIALINSPELSTRATNSEILPQTQPDMTVRTIDLEGRISTAYHNRPEIQEAAESIKQSEVLRHFSINQLLPRLTFSLESSFNGLAAEADLAESFNNQFSSSATYQLGLNFEVPLGNRQARFSRRRAELELARLNSRWRQVIETTKSEVQIASQEFQASQQLIQLQLSALRFSKQEIDYLQARKRTAPSENAIPSLELTQILSAQDRQVGAATSVIEAFASKQRALFQLNRASGIAVRSDVIPANGPLGRQGLLQVYHQYIEGEPEIRQMVDKVSREVRMASPTLHSPKRFR